MNDDLDPDAADRAEWHWRMAHHVIFAIFVACGLLAIAGMFAGPTQ